MHAIVLAAGFGSRLGRLGVTPKALLPFGGGVVLDHIVSVLKEHFSTIHVVHNNAVVDDGWATGKKPVNYDWPRMFRDWKKQAKCYIKLHNNGVCHAHEKVGSIGDLSWVIKDRIGYSRAKDGFFVVCADNIFSNLYLDRLLLDYGSSSITLRHIDSFHRSVLVSEPDRCQVRDGEVESLGRNVNSNWAFCGPFYLSARDFDFLFDYESFHRRAGVLPDSIGGFFHSLCEDQKVRACKVDIGDIFYDVGTSVGYEHAKRHAVEVVVS